MCAQRCRSIPSTTATAYGSTHHPRRRMRSGSCGLPRYRRACAWQSEREAAALPAAAHPDAPAKVLDDASADVQPESAAAGRAMRRLPELVEDNLAVAGIDTGPVVAHVDAQETALLGQADFHASLSRLADLGRVGEQVQHH